MSSFIQWAAPILSTLIITYLTARINQRIADGERKRDAARAETEAERRERAEWRGRVEERLHGQDERLETVLNAQCTLMRTDLIHKAHRYIDDLGCAGTEEKQAFWAEYEEYQAICDANDIVNHFVDQLVQQVMELPNRVVTRI